MEASQGVGPTSSPDQMFGGEVGGTERGLGALEGGGIKSDAILLIFRMACRHPAEL